MEKYKPKSLKGIPKKVKTTDLQRQAIDNVISGKYKHVAPAMRDAGYSKESSLTPRHALFERKGVQVYLRKLDKKSQKRFAMSLPEKVMDVYLDGLEATKLSGKKAIEHPDHPTRMSAADRFAKFFEWVKEPTATGGKYAQFNFFSLAENKRKQFDEKFKDFLKRFYE